MLLMAAETYFLCLLAFLHTSCVHNKAFDQPKVLRIGINVNNIKFMSSKTCFKNC